MEKLFLPSRNTYSTGEAETTGNYRKVIDRCKWLHLPPSFYLQENETYTWPSSHRASVTEQGLESNTVDFQINAQFTAPLSKAWKWCRAGYVPKQD